MKLLSSVSIIILLCASVILSQTDTNYIITEEILNELLEESQDEEISSDLYDLLEDLMQNPIDINTV